MKGPPVNDSGRIDMRVDLMDEDMILIIMISSRLRDTEEHRGLLTRKLESYLEYIQSSDCSRYRNGTVEIKNGWPLPVSLVAICEDRADKFTDFRCNLAWK